VEKHGAPLEGFHSKPSSVGHRFDSRTLRIGPLGPQLQHAPEIPILKLEQTQRRWLTRTQAHTLLGRFPAHTRDLMIAALALG
jgi:hypothetical protein